MERKFQIEKNKKIKQNEKFTGLGNTQRAYISLGVVKT